MTAYRPDSLIRDDVLLVLSQHGQAPQLLSQVGDGRVTLSGEVADLHTKHQLERLIAALPGVRGVHSLLNIEPLRETLPQARRRRG